MQKPQPNLHKVVELWDTWEKGKADPDQLLAQLKMHGLPEILKELVEHENNNTTRD